jgi:hypothetical protein
MEVCAIVRLIGSDSEEVTSKKEPLMLIYLSCPNIFWSDQDMLSVIPFVTGISSK